MLGIFSSSVGLFVTYHSITQLKITYTQPLEIHLQLNTQVTFYISKTLILTHFLPIYFHPSQQRSPVEGNQNNTGKANGNPFQKIYPILTLKTCNLKATLKNSILD